MSLLRTAARAAVATRVVGNVQRRQHQQWAAQDAAVAAQQAQAADDAAARLAATAAPAPAAPAPAAPAPAAAPDMTQVIAQLQQLSQLRDAGVLTDAEFEAQKQRLLGA
ncbi:SHOCT domain-containing protein [Microbacterium sp. NPDC057944]|uniref:SHOCT domain-containing protein n=1 Tax=Microbacterium sp. NPDC057944 TaxID=3346286 RepID=UPI0036DDD362